MPSDLSSTGKQLFIGNILFVICCVFYLAWWLLAFKPTNPIKGMKSGWLLAVAALAGFIGLFLLLRGLVGDTVVARFFPGWLILPGGITAYILLLFATTRLFQRPVTTELILIIGWAMLVIAEVNVLTLPTQLAWRLIAITVLATIISLICYVWYYRLGSWAGYIDGMVPLLLAGLMMALLSYFMAK